MEERCIYCKWYREKPITDVISEAWCERESRATSPFTFACLYFIRKEIKLNLNKMPAA